MTFQTYAKLTQQKHSRGTITTDLALSILTANDTQCQSLGVSETEICHRCILDWFEPSNRTEFTKLLDTPSTAEESVVISGNIVPLVNIR